MIGKLRKVGPR